MELNSQTVMRIKEVKWDSGEVKTYAITIGRFIDIANKSHYLGFAKEFALKPPSLERQFCDALSIHEELNRCAISATQEI